MAAVSPEVVPDCRGRHRQDAGSKVIEANRKRLNDFRKLYARWSLLLIFRAWMPPAGFGDQSVFDGVNPGLRGLFLQAALDPGTRPRLHVARHDRAAGAAASASSTAPTTRSYSRARAPRGAQAKLPKKLVTKNIGAA